MISFQENIEPTIRKIEEVLGLSFKVFVVTAVVVTLIGIYIANLLFGTYSLSVLQDLRKQEKTLERDIQNLKEENAKMHKKYLEWKDASSAH